jgi:hypothetical protein
MNLIVSLKKVLKDTIEELARERETGFRHPPD